MNLSLALFTPVTYSLQEWEKFNQRKKMSKKRQLSLVYCGSKVHGRANWEKRSIRTEWTVSRLQKCEYTHRSLIYRNHRENCDKPLIVFYD